LRLEVVGVTRGAPDVGGRSNPTIIATRAFDRTYRGKIAYSSRLVLARRVPSATAAQFHTAVNRLTSRNALGVFDAVTEDAPARHTVRTLSDGLVVFTVAAAIVAILIVGIAIGRHVAATATDQATLAALGLTRGARIRAAVATTTPIAVIGALGALAVSIAASPLMPVGLARRIEPDPGLHLDPLVAAITVVGVVAIVLIAAAIAAVPVTRLGSAHERVRRSSTVATALASFGTPPVVTTGVRLAFDRRPPAIPVRSALIGVSAAMVVVVAALTFSASLDRLADEPRRWGFGWDLMLDTTPNTMDRATRQLSSDTALTGVGVLSTNFAFANGNGIRAYGLDRIDGSVDYALLSGTQPVGPDEMVIGPKTARDWHVGIGDVARVAVCPCTGDRETITQVPVRIVGIALFPEDDDGNFNRALGFSAAGFARHVGSDEAPRWVLRVAGDHALSTVARDLGRRYPGQLSGYSYPSRPGEVENVTSLRSFPLFLVGFMTLLGLAALGNVLVTTVRRRRVELATLQSIGLTPRQTGACVLWQSMSVLAVALLVGIPLGLVLGAEVWAAITRGIGVATDASRPVAGVAVTSLAALVLALAVGASVGWRAARMRPAEALHGE
jgi:ABC-type lipoprotein release transport system permease subunit